METSPITLFREYCNFWRFELYDTSSAQNKMKLKQIVRTAHYQDEAYAGLLPDGWFEN